MTSGHLWRRPGPDAGLVLHADGAVDTALFGKPAFRNLVCNGLVLADDGKKMSKRLKNYPVRAHWPGSRNVHVSPLQHALCP